MHYHLVLHQHFKELIRTETSIEQLASIWHCSERYAKMCSVKKLSQNSYGVELPDGKQGVYIYSKGQCSEVQTDLGGFKLRIVLQEDK